MTTTTKVQLTVDQREKLAQDLRVPLQAIPTELGIMAISPEAAANMGLPEDLQSRFAPSLIIT